MYYNSHGEKFIRSGKVTGNSRSFITRQLEHEKGAGLKMPVTLHSMTCIQLRIAVVLYVHRGKDILSIWYNITMAIFQKDYNNGGIFFYSKE